MNSQLSHLAKSYHGVNQHIKSILQPAEQITRMNQWPNLEFPHTLLLASALSVVGPSHTHFHPFFGQHTGKGNKDADSEENIDHREELGSRRARTKVPIPDRRKRDHAKIQGIKPTPTLFQVVKTVPVSEIANSQTRALNDN